MSSRRRSRPKSVLIVDDSPTSVRLTEILLAELDPKPSFQVARDGESALEWLRGAGPANDRPLPDLVLMDWRLPGRQAGEILSILRQDPRLRAIPVIVHSASAGREDVKAAYAAGANAYVAKADDLDDFREAIRAIDHLWLRRNETPS